MNIITLSHGFDETAGEAIGLLEAISVSVVGNRVASSIWNC